MSVDKRKIKVAFQRAIEALDDCDDEENGDIHDELCQAVAHLTVAMAYAKKEAP